MKTENRQAAGFSYTAAVFESGADEIYLDNDNTAAADALGRLDFLDFILICGGSGAGKSHLVYESVIDYSRRRPAKKVSFADTADIVERLCRFISAGAGYTLEDICPAADVLVLDNAGCLSGRPATQHKIVSVINAVIRKSGKVIMITDTMDTLDRTALTRLETEIRHTAFVYMTYPSTALKRVFAADYAERIRADIDRGRAEAIADCTDDMCRIKGRLNSLSFCNKV